MARAEAWLWPANGGLEGTIWVWPKRRLCATAWRVDAHQRDGALILVPRGAPGCEFSLSQSQREAIVTDPEKLACLVASSAFCSYS